MIRPRLVGGDRTDATASPLRKRGFTLLELLFTVVIAAVFGTIALHSYRKIIEEQKVRMCVLDLAAIAIRIEQYRTQHGQLLPDSLDDLPAPPPMPLDPWGNPYRFLNFSSGEPGINAEIRKDHNLHPLNSEFDLYSAGPDGDSRAPLTARPSRDDILWARDGSFIGRASEF